MKRLCLLVALLPSCFVAAPAGAQVGGPYPAIRYTYGGRVPWQQPYRIALRVEATPPALRSRIETLLARRLGTIPDVEIVDWATADYSLDIRALGGGWGASDSDGFALSALIVDFFPQAPVAWALGALDSARNDSPPGQCVAAEEAQATLSVLGIGGEPEEVMANVQYHALETGASADLEAVLQDIVDVLDVDVLEPVRLTLSR
jgi:hypothetical protein